MSAVEPATDEACSHWMVGQAVEVELGDRTSPGIIREVYEPVADEKRVVVDVDGKEELRDTDPGRIEVIS